MDVFSLVAKLTLDSSEYDNNLDQAKSSASTFGEKLKSGLKTAAKVGGAAIATAAAGIAALTKNAVENYAEYEQLVGGVETLFKNSADLVQGYAANAYKTAGLSANEYMETVTSFSASLLQSLDGDTEKAAQIGDMAISDMADNANKMGTAMESIQNAYQGFAKQNYTMLDNLKLGYGGTKSEMERLLEDATALSGIDYDIESLSDVYEAIHVIQESLDITGTTAKEASETISGSLSAMKSAWSNLVTGVADENANFSELVDNFVESAATVGENIIPRVEQALTGIGRLVEGLAPVIVNAVPMLVTDVLPTLLASAASLVESIGGALIDSLPVILDAGLELILTLANGIADSLPELIPTLVDVVLQIVDTLTSPDTVIRLVGAALSIIVALADGLMKAIPQLLEAVPEIIGNLITAIIGAMPQFVIAGYELLTALIADLPDIIAKIMTFLPSLLTEIITGLIDSIPLIIEAGVELLTAIVDDLPTIITNIVTAIPHIIMSIVEALINNLGKIIESGIKLIVALAEGMIKAIPQLLRAIPQIIIGIVQGFVGTIDEFINVGKRIVEGVWEGITSMATWIADKVKGFFTGIVDGIKGLLGIHSPSKVFAGIGENMAAGLGKGWDDEFSDIQRDINGDLDFGTRTVDINRRLSNGYVNGGYGSAAQSQQPIRIEFTGDLAQLARVLQPKIVDETNRRGISYVTA